MRIAKLAAGLAGVCAIGFLAGYSPLIAAAAVGGLFSVLVWVLWAQEVFVSRLVQTLLFTSFVAIWFPPLASVGGFNVRASYPFLALGLLVIAGWRHRLRVAGDAKTHASLLVVLCGAAAFWTALRNPGLEPAGHVILLVVNVTFLVVGQVLLDSLDGVDSMFLNVASVAMFAVIAWNVLVFIGAAHGSPFFMSLFFVERLTSASGEAQDVSRFQPGVITGAYSAALTVILFISAAGARGRRRLLYVLAGAVSMIGVVLGIARGAIIVVGIGPCILAAVFVRRREFRRVGTLAAGSVLIGIVALGIAAAIVFLPGGDTIRDAFIGKVAQLFLSEQYSQGTAQSRLDFWSGMANDIVHEPFAGQGMDAFKKYFPAELKASENFPLEIFHSTGLIGFIAYLMPLLLVFAHAWRTLIRSVGHSSRWWTVAGMFSGMVGLTLSSATNPAAWNGLYWLLIGCLAATSRALALPSAGRRLESANISSLELTA